MKRKVEISELGRELLTKLPPIVRSILLHWFEEDVSNEETVKNFAEDNNNVARAQQENNPAIIFFDQNSNISNILRRNPASFKMLEIIYTGNGLNGVIDDYFYRSLAGEALRNRLSVVISRAGKIIEALVKKNGNIKVANLGSGPGRDIISIFEKNPIFSNSVLVDCFDYDPEAIKKGKELWQKTSFSQSINFFQQDFLKLQYREEVDMALLIGVLCGLPYESCVKFLRIVKRYLKPGAILIASNVSTVMLEKDFFTAWLLCNLIGWKLIYKKPETLQQIFEEAGYEWKGVFWDEPHHFHTMGVGMVPL